MMKQVQNIQKEVTSEKSKIDQEVYTATKSFVTVEMKGSKELVSVKLDADMEDIDKDMLEDLILVSVNEVIKKIDDDVEKRLGKYTKGMPGLF